MSPERIDTDSQLLYSVISQIFLLKCPNHTEGLNIKRVKAFAQGKNLQIAPFRLCKLDELEEVAKELPEEFGQFLIDYLPRYRNRITQASYWNPLGVAIVPREVEQEKAGGAVQREALLVHEAVGHGSSVTSTQPVRIDNTRGTVRDGFHLVERRKSSIKYWGSWLEEAFAGRLEGEYKERYGGIERCKEAEEVTGFKVTEESTIAFQFIENEMSYPILLPLSYLNIEFLGFDTQAEKVFGITPPQIAGFTLDLLIQQDPELEDLMLISRSNPLIIRDIVKRLNKFEKNLFGYLQRAPLEPQWNTFTEALEKYAKVVDILYDGDLSKLFYGGVELQQRFDEVMEESNQ